MIEIPFSVMLSFPRVQSSFLHAPFGGVYCEAELIQLALPRRWSMNREPTVIQIVDRIMTLDCGESCDVKLNPHITRIGNMKWLLPICVQQFGTQIDIREHPEGDDVVLTITATATRRHKMPQPTSRTAPIALPEEEPAGVAADQLVAVA
jgi:hypothetical protein